MIPISEVKAKVAEIGKTLLSTDSRFRRSVLLVTIDSSQFYRNAFVIKWKGFYLLFTEHHGYHFEHEDEVLRCLQFGKQVTIQEG